MPLAVSDFRVPSPDRGSRESLGRVNEKAAEAAALGWPLVGDATIFHLIAGQMTMGAVPYRDIIDVNMPLTYDIHAAVVAIGGMSDVAWRVFDLTAAAVMSALILLLVGPAGRVAVPASFGHKVTLAR